MIPDILVNQNHLTRKSRFVILTEQIYKKVIKTGPQKENKHRRASTIFNLYFCNIVLAWKILFSIMVFTFFLLHSNFLTS